MPARALILDLDLSAYGREGTVAFLREAAAGAPVVVRAEASRADAEAALLAAGLLDILEAVVSVDDVEYGLPDPGGHLLAVARLNEERSLAESIVAADVLALEESDEGVSAARAAGVRCVLVGSGNGATGARRSIERLDASAAEALLR